MDLLASYHSSVSYQSWIYWPAYIAPWVINHGSVVDLSWICWLSIMDILFVNHGSVGFQSWICRLVIMDLLVANHLDLLLNNHGSVVDKSWVSWFPIMDLLVSNYGSLGQLLYCRSVSYQSWIRLLAIRNPLVTNSKPAGISKSQICCCWPVSDFYICQSLIC